MQSSLRKRWGRGQKVVAYPDVFFTMLNLFSSFTDDNMMSQAITLHDEFIIIYKGDYFIFGKITMPFLFTVC